MEVFFKDRINLVREIRKREEEARSLIDYSSMIESKKLFREEIHKNNMKLSEEESSMRNENENWITKLKSFDPTSLVSNVANSTKSISSKRKHGNIKNIMRAYLK
jgi:hypothetical protein